MLSQTTANYTDLIFIAFFLSCFYFVLRFVADLRTRQNGGGNLAHLLLAGIAGGLALGAKVLGVIYLGVLALLLAVEEPGKRKRPSQRSSRSFSTLRTVGLKVIARPPGGSIRTSSLAPSRRPPLTGV